MSSERTTAPRMPADPADPAARAQGRSIAGLIDVLDRAEGAGPVRRPQGRRSVGHRPPGARPGLVRTVPLRSVQPAPMARPAPAPRVVVLPEPERVPVTRLSDVFRRAAMWGAGPRGEHLAWRVAPHSAAPAARRPGGCVPSSAGWRCGAPVPRASTSPGAGPPARPLAGTSTHPWCCARCPAPPWSSLRRLPPPRCCFPAIRRRRPAREECRRSPAEQWPSPA